MHPARTSTSASSTTSAARRRSSTSPVGSNRRRRVGTGAGSRGPAPVARSRVLAVASKTKMTALVRAFQSNEVRAGLSDDAALLGHRDERGRNWLHVCCSASASTAAARRDSVRTADVLLDLGLDLDAPAFVEGEWQATPCWYSVARGRNLALTRHLLERGCDPNHSLFAAACNDDLPAITLP